MWDLIVSVPDHCLSSYFAKMLIVHMNPKRWLDKTHSNNILTITIASAVTLSVNLLTITVAFSVNVLNITVNCSVYMYYKEVQPDKKK